jgi:hypothetical protein
MGRLLSSAYRRLAKAEFKNASYLQKNHPDSLEESAVIGPLDGWRHDYQASGPAESCSHASACFKRTAATGKTHAACDRRENLVDVSRRLEKSVPGA